METMNFAAIPSAKSPEEQGDLGFGAVVSTVSRKRLLNADGSFNVQRVGLPWSEAVSLYHSALTLRWPGFFGWVIAIYFGINVTFAALYLLCGQGSIIGSGSATTAGPFATAFFFSVETFATIGYGNLSPAGPAAHFVMTVEALVGVLAQALITGLFFARFARPTAAVTFSKQAVIAPFKDGNRKFTNIFNPPDADGVMSLDISRLDEMQAV